MKHCAANMSIPTVELPPSETLDVLGFARGCAQVLNALIQSFAVQSELSPVETVESLLGLKDCLARLEAWNVALSGAASKLNPSTPSSAPLAMNCKSTAAVVIAACDAWSIAERRYGYVLYSSSRNLPLLPIWGILHSCQFHF